jgi:signal transduction histidine kinase
MDSLKTSSKQSISPRLRALWVFVGVLVIATFIGIYEFYRGAYRLEVENATLNATAANKAFAEHTNRIVTEVDTILRAVRGYYQRTKSVEETEQFIASLNYDNHFIENIFLLDAQGYILIPQKDRAKGLNAKHRDFYKFHTEIAEDTIFISPVSRGQVTGKLQFRVTRRMSNPDGTFAGLVLAPVEPKAFTDYYRTLLTSKDSIATLLGITDRKVRARMPEAEDAVWHQTVESPVWKALEQTPSGQYRNRSPIDQKDRAFSYQQVRDLPLVIVNGYSESDIQESVGHRMVQVGIVAGSAIIIMFGLATFLTIVYRQRDVIKQHNEQLEILVNERTAALSVAKQRAEAANVAKSAFLANMSHEMRTPLNHIIGLATLIRREPLTPKQTDKLGKLDAASHHLTTLISTILDLTLIEAGKFDLVEEPFKLDELLLDVVTSVHDQATEKNLKVTAAPHTSPALLIGDRQHIQKALLNFVTNAIRFTEVGSVTIRSQVTENDKESVMIRFEVEDTGVGISAEDQDRLFSIFEQVDNSSTRKFGGLGVGLAMTKKLAQIMGGDAGCVSHPDKGSTFWFAVRLKKG